LRVAAVGIDIYHLPETIFKQTTGMPRRRALDIRGQSEVRAFALFAGANVVHQERLMPSVAIKGTGVQAPVTPAPLWQSLLLFGVPAVLREPW